MISNRATIRFFSEHTFLNSIGKYLEVSHIVNAFLTFNKLSYYPTKLFLPFYIPTILLCFDEPVLGSTLITPFG